jgi:hypothetical protein
MKFIVRTIFILCFISIGTILEAATADNECLLIEEGWRSRKYLAVNFYDAYYGVDFTALHAEMSAQEASIANAIFKKSKESREPNVVLVRFSILTESPSGGLTVYPNFYRLYSKQPKEKGGRSIPGEEFVFVSGTPTENVIPIESRETYRVVGAELASTPDIMADCTRQYRGVDMEESVLKFTQAQEDNEALYATLQKPITHPQNPIAAKEAIDRIAHLAGPYSDSERHITRAMHGKPLKKDANLLEEFITQLKMGFIVPGAPHIGERVKAIIMHLHTKMDPCSTCGPMLLRELEGANGFAKLWKERIARFQRGLMPDFVLLASSREPHGAHTTTFTGRDNAYNHVINASTFPPFYPLKRFWEGRLELPTASVGAAGVAGSSAAGMSAAASFSDRDIAAATSSAASTDEELLPSPEKVHASRIRSYLSIRGGIELWKQMLNVQPASTHGARGSVTRTHWPAATTQDYIDARKIDAEKPFSITLPKTPSEARSWQEKAARPTEEIPEVHLWKERNTPYLADIKLDDDFRRLVLRRASAAEVTSAASIDDAAAAARS